MLGTAALVLIVASMPVTGVDYAAVAEHLRAAARAAGCAQPVVEMAARVDDNTFEIAVRCPAPAKEETR